MRSRNDLAYIPQYNKKLLVLIMALLVFGLFVIYNATSYFSQTTFGNPFRFVFLQIGWIFAGIVGFIFFSKINYNFLKKITPFVTTGSVLFLTILAFVGLFLCGGINDRGTLFVPCLNGASRWFFLNPSPFPSIPLIGVLGFQPGELAKFAVILYLALKLDFSYKDNKNLPFYIYLATGVVFSFLLLLQPNMSTAILVFLICTVMYFVSGHSIKPLILVSPALLISALAAVLSSSYRRQRLFTLLGLIKGGEQEMGYHIRQILIALGTGGLFGVGFGQSRQKFQYLPEISSDSIFAIIGEEFGFVGTTLVISAFFYLIYLGMQIAKTSQSSYGKMLAVGITSWIGIQFFINIAAMIKLIPLTGMPIPLISYGGSSMVFSLSILGILYNIGKQSS